MSLRRCVFAVCIAVFAAIIGGCAPRHPDLSGGPLPSTRPAKPFTHETGIRFVVLPAGKIETRYYAIEMRRRLMISAHEVTNKQYEAFDPKHERSPASPGDAQPVANVTAKQAEAFCKWLTKNDPLGRNYKPPNGVEWEYAARGGASHQTYPWGNKADPTRACYGAEGAKPVGGYPPNAFGLYDVAGNVAEWVRTNGFPPYDLRGGSWKDGAAGLAVVARGTLPETGETLDHHGFRVLCEPGPLQ